MDRLAGVLGIDPGPLTLRTLLTMADARTQHDWAQTSSLMALIANVHRPRNKTPFEPGDFNPCRSTHMEQPREKADITILKDLFVKPRKSPAGLCPGSSAP